MRSMRSIRPLVVLLLIAAAACRGKAPAQSKQQYLDSGNKYAADKKYSEAIVEYRNAIKADPKFGQARAQLADAYLRTNDLRNALREFVVAADLLPTDADAQIKAGQMLLLAGRFEDAKTRAEKAIAIDP